jgi:hypothetical protein
VLSGSVSVLSGLSRGWIWLDLQILLGRWTCSCTGATGTGESPDGWGCVASGFLAAGFFLASLVFTKVELAPGGKWEVLAVLGNGV